MKRIRITDKGDKRARGVMTSWESEYSGRMSGRKVGKEREEEGKAAIDVC